VVVGSQPLQHFPSIFHYNCLLSPAFPCFSTPSASELTTVHRQWRGRVAATPSSRPSTSSPSSSARSCSRGASTPARPATAAPPTASASSARRRSSSARPSWSSPRPASRAPASARRSYSGSTSSSPRCSSSPRYASPPSRSPSPTPAPGGPCPAEGSRSTGSGTTPAGSGGGWRTAAHGEGSGAASRRPACAGACRETGRSTSLSTTTSRRCRFVTGFANTCEKRFFFHHNCMTCYFTDKLTVVLSRLDNKSSFKAELLNRLLLYFIDGRKFWFLCLLSFMA
jgi:hypothetical protein